MPFAFIKNMLTHGFNPKQLLVRELNSNDSNRPNIFFSLVSKYNGYSDLHKNLLAQLILEKKSGDENLTVFFQTLNANVDSLKKDSLLIKKLSRYFSVFPEQLVFLSDAVKKEINISFQWIEICIQNEIWKMLYEIENFNLVGNVGQSLTPSIFIAGGSDSTSIRGNNDKSKRLLKLYNFLASVDFGNDIHLIETLVEQSLLTLSTISKAEMADYDQRFQESHTTHFGSMDLQFFELAIGNLLTKVLACTSDDNREKIILTIFSICNQHSKPKRSNSELYQILPKFYIYANSKQKTAIENFGIENTKSGSINYLIFFSNLFMMIRDDSQMKDIFDRLVLNIDIENPDRDFIKKCAKIVDYVSEISQQSSAILTNALLALLKKVNQPLEDDYMEYLRIADQKQEICEICDNLVGIYDKAFHEDKLKIKLYIKSLTDFSFIYPSAYITLLAIDIHADLDIQAELDELKKSYGCKYIINVVNTVHPHLLNLLVRMFGEDAVDIPSFYELNNREAKGGNKIESLIKSPSLQLMAIKTQHKFIKKYIEEMLQMTTEYTANIIAHFSCYLTREQKIILVGHLEQTIQIVSNENHLRMLKKLLFEYYLDLDVQKAESQINEFKLKDSDYSFQYGTTAFPRLYKLPTVNHENLIQQLMDKSLLGMGVDRINPETKALQEIVKDFTVAEAASFLRRCIAAYQTNKASDPRKTNPVAYAHMLNVCNEIYQQRFLQHSSSVIKVKTNLPDTVNEMCINYLRR